MFFSFIKEGYFIMARKYNNLLFVFSIIIILISLTNLFVTFIKVSDFKETTSGYVSGYVNLTVHQIIILNISRDTIDWGAGVIDGNESNATLYTSGDNNGFVLRGNWSGSNARAFVIENLGTSNCSISVKTGKDAHDFFLSASSSNEEYMINVSDKDPGSCYSSLSLGWWYDVNKTGSGTRYCDQFSFFNESNEIYMDVLLTVPDDAGVAGVQTDIISIIGDAPV